ncbi:MAG: DUF2461 domain-containing protein [Bacteroidales bacterium]|nr:DUF2461 domain-containing protein [Bacteroidales bacterium]
MNQDNIMKQAIAFFEQLMRHNNKDWFTEHKAEFVRLQDAFKQFTQKLILGIGTFDSEVGGLEIAQCTYRIYRDIRFSNDKRPYKTHFGAYVCPGGKCSGKAGYYFHLEPAESEYLNGSMMAVGIYNPSSAVLKSIREEIITNGDEFDAAVKEAKNFSFGENQKLKRVPNGFPKDSEYAEYLKLKEYSMALYIPDKILYSEDLLDYLLVNFKSAQHYNQILNKAFAVAEV